MKKVEQQVWLYGLIGMLVGISVTSLIAMATVGNQHDDLMKKMDSYMNTAQPASHGDMSMGEMTAQLQSKSGDEFDKAFLEMMIAHHQGAIDMAELIPTRAQHQEIKDLGQAIISAQTKEINDMRQWQKDWGYASDDMDQMMHGN